LAQAEVVPCLEDVGLQMGWCASSGTIQDIQAKLQQKQEGIIKRERAKAYASTHQVHNIPVK